MKVDLVDVSLLNNEVLLCGKSKDATHGGSLECGHECLVEVDSLALVVADGNNESLAALNLSICIALD